MLEGQNSAHNTKQFFVGNFAVRGTKDCGGTRGEWGDRQVLSLVLIFTGQETLAADITGENGM